MINQPNPTFSDLPGTETQTPAQDELEARRFPQFQAPVPRIPGIPAPRIAKPAKAAGGGGGLNMDTLMPLLLMAAPFLEAHQPGYGLGLVQGVLQHQDEVAQTRRNTVFTMAKEFANTADEDWPAVAAVLKQQGLDTETIAAIKGVIPALRGPDYAQNQYLRKIQGFLAPELTQAGLTGKPFDPTQMPVERFQGLQKAFPGALPSYGVTGAPAQAAVPGGGELGQRTPPVAAVPSTERVVQRGAAPGPLLTDFIAGYRIRQGMDQPARMLLSTLQNRVNAGQMTVDQAVKILDTSPYLINPKDDAARFEGRVSKVQSRLETLANSGALTGDALAQVVATANQALASDAKNSGQTFQGLDTRMIEAKLPKPESIVMLNTNTGQRQTLTLPAGTKLHTYSPPNAPTRHMLVYPDGHREWLDPGVVPTLVPPRTLVDKVSPADKEVLGIFFNANSYAQLKTRPQAEQDAFGKRFQQALKNIGVNVMPTPLPPPSSPWWDGIKRLFMTSAQMEPGGSPTAGTIPQAAGPPPVPTAWTPPPGAIRGTDRSTGKVVYKVGNIFYDENGVVVK